jgi:DNA repair exonuclease SbcCD nuclease subunit
MFTFIHAADIHLDSPLRGLERYEGAPVDEIRGATRRAFDNLIDLAIEERVTFVLIAGDLYDGDWRDYNTGLYFAKRMGLLREAGIRVFIGAGNHDAGSQITKVLRLPDNVKVLSTRAPETILLEDLGVAVHGQGFPNRSVTEDLSAGYPRADSQLFNIGLLHTSLDGRPGHEPYAPCTVDGLRSKGYQYWALGHVHQREVVSQDPWMVFPGNTQGRHVREAGAKGCSLVTVADGEVESVQHRDLDVVRWSLCAVDLTGAATADEAYDRTRDALEAVVGRTDGRLAAVRLKLSGPCRAHARLRADREHWIQEFRGLASVVAGGSLWLEKVEIDTRRADSLGAALGRDDAFGGLLRSIRDLDVNPARLAGLAADLSDLRTKLPPALLSGGDALDPTDPVTLREALEDVKEMLLERLLREGPTA